MFPLSFNDLRRLIRFISIDEFVARVIYRWIELWRSFRYDEIFSPVPTRETMRSDIFARASIRATLERLRFLSLWSKVTSLVQQLLSIAKIPLLWGVSPSFVSRYLRDERERKKRKKRKSGMKFSLSSMIEYILFAKLLIFSRTMIWKNINIFFSRANKWQFEINQKIFDEDCLNEWSINDLLNNPIHY